MGLFSDALPTMDVICLNANFSTDTIIEILNFSNMECFLSKKNVDVNGGWSTN